MSTLNGKWSFYYSEEQEKTEDNGTYVDIDGEWKQYTECIHTKHTQNNDYEPHEERFEDSELVGRINNPEIKRGSYL